MRRVISSRKFGHTSKGKQIYTVQLDDGTEGSSLDELKVGDMAQSYFDERYNKIKIFKVDNKASQG